jgi:hypothetical protein
LPGLAALLLRFSGGESGLALASDGSVRLLDALGVGAAGIWFAARLLDTSKQRISSSSLWTRAEGVAGLGVADSSGSARVRVARILEAISFLLTGCGFNWQARWGVFHDITLLVSLAGAGLFAGVDALAVGAGLLRGAVPVGGTTDNFDTAVVLVNRESWRAELADRDVVLDYTGGVSGAALSKARVDALVVDAGLGGGAATVLETDRHAGLALLVAHADGLVLQDLARLASRTGSSLAGVLAGAVDASQVDGTFGITPAGHLSFRTGQISGRRDDQLVLASTGGLVVPGDALLVGVADGSVAARRVA